MNFKLTEEHIMIRDAARDFAKSELLPGVIERDNKQEFPTQQIKMMGEMGFLGMMVDPKYGGGGMDTLSYVLAMEELSKIDASASVIMSVNNSLVCYGLEKYANEEVAFHLHKTRNFFERLNKNTNTTKNTDMISAKLREELRL